MDDTFNPKDANGPYKATLLWREAVRGFRAGMPGQRHWRQFRFHDDCFTANAAVTWLHGFLLGHDLFSTEVTRQQAVRLLSKFLDAGIVVAVRTRKDADVFKDNNDLYRLSATGTPGRSAITLAGGSAHSSVTSAASPVLRPLNGDECDAAVARTLSPHSAGLAPVGSPRLRRRVGAAVRIKRRFPTQSSRDADTAPSDEGPSSHPSCSRPMIPCVTVEVHLLWKRALLSRLEVLMCKPARDIVSEADVVAQWIEHNTTRVSERGLTAPLSSSQASFPSWVLLAMQCLANWPESDLAPSSVNYAGFERDVMNALSDYFRQQPFPLVPCTLYDSLLAAWLHAEAADIKHRRDRLQGLPSAISLPPPAPGTPPSSGGGSLERLLLLMSPQTSTPVEGRCADTVENMELFSPPPLQPATPAVASVARLRRRLLKLGVGETGTRVPDSGFCRGQFRERGEVGDLVGEVGEPVSLPAISRVRLARATSAHALSTAVSEGQSSHWSSDQHEAVKRSPVYSSCSTDSAVGSSLDSTEPPSKHLPPHPPHTCLETVFNSAGGDPLTRRIRQRSVEALHLANTSIDSDAESSVSMGRRHVPLVDSRSLRRLKQRRQNRHAAVENTATPGGSNTHHSHSGSKSVVSQKAARVLGIPQPSAEEPAQQRPLGPPRRGRARQRTGEGVGSLMAWQRRSVADPSRVTELSCFSNDNNSSITDRSPLVSRLSVPTSLQQHCQTGCDNTRTIDAGGKSAGVCSSGLNRPLTPRSLSVGAPAALSLPPPSSIPLYQDRYRVTSTIHTAVGHRLARECLQLLLSLLPPANRRQLQLLMRFMQLAAGNNQLQLVDSTGAGSTRQLLLERFAGCVLCSRDSGTAAAAVVDGCCRGDDTLVVRRLVAYIMDHQSDILVPSAALLDTVKQEQQQQQSAAASIPSLPPATSYCQTESCQQFEQLRRWRSTEALLSLLDLIISDTDMPRREKRRRLKQFREAYPEIYSQRLLEADTELWHLEQSMRHRGKRSTLLHRASSLSSLARSRSLRL